MFPPDVKICGLMRRSDAEAAAAAGARYGGVILASGGKRSVAVAAAGALFSGLPLAPVGVFVDASADAVAEAAGVAGLRVVQLHGSEPVATARALRADGRWAVWKAVRVRDADSLARAAEEYADEVDALLLDGWSPNAPGGTGTRFDWDALAARRAELPDTLAVVVAGGLDPENVARAIEALRPRVVDVSSGVESAPGVKDPAAISAFIAAARGAARKG